jgi:hypothetical protein
MSVLVNKFGITRYLTGNKIQDVLRSIARAVHPDLTEDEIKRFSSHSGRVWALVLLNEVGMLPAFMTSRLRWMGDSYKLYLRDTSILQHKQVDALSKEPDEVMRLLGNNRDILPDIVPADDETGEYYFFLNFYPIPFSFIFLFLFFLFSFCMLALHYRFV